MHTSNITIKYHVINEVFPVITTNCTYYMDAFEANNNRYIVKHNNHCKSHLAKHIYKQANV